MFSLTLNNKPAVIKSGASFKFTFSNNIFSEGEGSKTFDVTLPLAGCAQNRAIFGTFLHSPYVGKEDFAERTYKFSLTGDNIHVDGTAYLTKLTETEATVQLLCDMTAFRNIADASETYVDELDLGCFWDGLKDVMPGIEMEDEEGRVLDIIYPWENYRELEKYVAADIYAEKTTGQRPVDFLLGKGREAAIVPLATAYAVSDDETTYEDTNDISYNSKTGHFSIAGTNVCPAPYILNVLKRICSALGYAFSAALLPDATFVRDVVLVHRFRTVSVADSLPHCTLDKFLEELEKALGVYFYATEKTVYIVSLAAKYPAVGGKFVCLDDVVDEEEVEINKEEEPKSVMQENMVYDFNDVDERLCLSDDTWEAGKVRTFPNYTALAKEANALSTYERNKSQYIYVDTSTGKVYVWLHVKGWKAMGLERYETMWQYELVEVDQAGRRLADYADPTNVTKVTAVPPFMVYKATSGGRHFMLSLADACAFPKTETVDSLIFPEDNAAIDDDAFDTKEDGTAMFLAVFGTGASTSSPDRAPTGIGIPYALSEETGRPVYLSGIRNENQEYDTNVWMMKKASAGSIGATLAACVAVGHRVVHCFSFTDHIDADPYALYLIKGRRYLCQKLEVTFNEDGVLPLKKGYFYEVV